MDRMEGRILRSGFTTGTCAAVAAKAAAVMVFTGEILKHMNLVTPKGTEADLPLFHVALTTESAVCAVIKDAGDDPDVTNRAMVYASVRVIGSELTKQEQTHCYIRECGKEPCAWTLYLTGGEGIGIVTKPGLSCPVGKYAINPVPRRMIFDAVEEAARRYGVSGRLLIRISIPAGKELADKTFNPKLGIQGGISILGTSGVVEPMSEEALLATIRLELHMKAVEGVQTVIVTPGNYGETFLREKLGLSLKHGIQCSNFVADAMGYAADEGILEILFVGHIGKLIKVAGGVRNTHSKYGDRRMEILWECAEQVLKSRPQVEAGALKAVVMEAVTTEEAVRLLEEAGILKQVMTVAVARIKRYTTSWCGGMVRVEAVMFSTDCGLLGMTKGAENMMKTLRGRE